MFRMPENWRIRWPELGLRRSCSMSLRYCGDIDPPPSSFITRAASSFWLRPSSLRAFAIARPKVIPSADICGSSRAAPCQSACSRICELILLILGVINRKVLATGPVEAFGREGLPQECRHPSRARVETGATAAAQKAIFKRRVGSRAKLTPAG